MTKGSKGREVSPHWLMKLLGAESATFRLAENGLSVESTKGEHYVVLVESLSNKAAFREGRFFSRLVLLTDKGEKVFRDFGDSLLNWLSAI